MQNKKNKYKIKESKQDGLILEVYDQSFADYFEDYIAENHYVHFHIKFENEKVVFYFGEAADIEKVNKLACDAENNFDQEKV